MASNSRSAREREALSEGRVGKVIGVYLELCVNISSRRMLASGKRSLAGGAMICKADAPEAAPELIVWIVASYTGGTP